MNVGEYEGGFVKQVSLPTLNFHQFNPHVQFTSAGYVNSHGEPIHRIRMVDVGSRSQFQMGKLHWNANTGEIQNVETDPNYQRLGVANTMLAEAKEAAKLHGLMPPVHSSNRTDEGQAWAKATKEKLPRRKRVNYFN
jgi:ribosomal protein S18 acetylase RimI-like enzyme